MNRFIFAAILFFCGTVLSQPIPDMNLGSPTFKNNLGFFPSEDSGMTDIEVYVSIPFQGLQFLKATEGYRAHYSTLVALYKDKKLIGKVDRYDSVEVDRYSKTSSSQTTSPEPFILEGVKPGEYSMLIKLQDEESRKNFSRKAEIMVPRFFADEPRLSSLVLLDNNGNPHLGEFYSDMDSVFYKISLYLPEGYSAKLIVALKTHGDLVESDTIQKIGTGKTYKFTGDFAMPLEHDGIDIHAELWNEGKLIDSIDKSRNYIGYGYGVNSQDPKETLDQMRILFKESEIRELRRILEESPSELDSSIKELWKSVDPTQGTDQNELKDEFYRRVSVANQRYGVHMPGWQTDRGRIYILYGEPDDIERHPFDLEYNAYEVWYYYQLGRTYYFEDRIGDGTYELIKQE